MTEPETMSYTVSHFKNQPSGTQMRSMIFDKYATVAKPWMISDSIINYFEVDKQQAKENAKRWWESEGTFSPEHTGPASQHLATDSFNLAREYAVMEAGRSRVK